MIGNCKVCNEHIAVNDKGICLDCFAESTTTPLEISRGEWKNHKLEHEHQFLNNIPAEDRA